MGHRYDGTGAPLLFTGAEVRTESEIARIRKDIERLWLTHHSLRKIAEFTWLEVDEIRDHLVAMSDSTAYDVTFNLELHELG